jgi:NAD(P)-dependent dehydrogenase (short-subunit alcohol dehydrogenase family)
VVGASSGIGAEVARQCASAGAVVSICARREDRLREVHASLEGGRPHRYSVLDVADRDAIEPRLEAFAKESGPIGGLVYAAGYSKLLPLQVLSAKQLDGILQVNLVGGILATKAAVKRAPKTGTSIVWISSVAPRRPGGGGMTAYAASKGGMEAALVALASELAPRKIRINAIAPGAVETEIWNGSFDPEQLARIVAKHPLGVGQPRDVALGCVYLLSEAARWITGTVLSMDGGFATA